MGFICLATPDMIFMASRIVALAMLISKVYEELKRAKLIIIVYKHKNGEAVFTATPECQMYADLQNQI